MEREIVAVSVRERERFGQELHAGLSQQLTGLKFKISLLEHRLQSKGLPEAGEAKAISQLLNEAMEEASRLAHGFRSIQMDGRGLMTALRELAANVTRVRRVKCGCEFRRSVFIRDDNVAMQLCHIAEEAVSNAVRHGEATEIWIVLNETKDHVSLTVRDNGRGLPKSLSEVGGLGLRLMRYRARIIGGSIELRHNKPRGVMLLCHLEKTPVAR